MNTPNAKEILADPLVGPIVKRYLAGRIATWRARRELLLNTVMHVEALSLLDAAEEEGLQQLAQYFPAEPVSGVAEGETNG